MGTLAIHILLFLLYEFMLPDMALVRTEQYLSDKSLINILKMECFPTPNERSATLWNAFCYTRSYYVNAINDSSLHPHPTLGDVNYDGNEVQNVAYYKFLIPYIVITPLLMLLPSVILKTMQDPFLAKILEEVDWSLDATNACGTVAKYFCRNINEQTSSVRLFHFLEFLHTILAAGHLFGTSAVLGHTPWTLITSDGTNLFPHEVSCRMGKMAISGKHLDFETTKCLLSFNWIAWPIVLVSICWMFFVVAAGLANILHLMLVIICCWIRQWSLLRESGNLINTQNLRTLAHRLSYCDFFILSQIVASFPSHTCEDLIEQIHTSLYVRKVV